LPVRKILFLVSLTACAAVLFVLRVEAAESRNVRVALVTQADAVSFKVEGNYRLVDQSTGREIARLVPGESCRAVLKGGKLELYGKNRYGAFNGPVTVRPESFGISIVGESGNAAERLSADGLFVLNGEGRIIPLAGVTEPAVEAAGGVSLLKTASGLDLVSLTAAGETRRYRGSMEFRLENGKISAINELDIEDYLRGVVPSEMYPFWPQEALKAQAVASRNYALQRMEETGGSAFNLSNNQLNQVYKGYDAETAATNRAVDETRGMVMLSKGSLISAFFHSSSGGYTENSEDVWTYPLPYIKWKADPYDKNGDHYDWQVKYTAQQLMDKLKSAGYDFKKIRDVKEVARTDSGARVKKITVVGDGPPGGRVDIFNADRVRTALGLKSARFSMKKVFGRDSCLTEVTFTGSGLGHGLGMSQYGACGMAKQGYNYQDILKYYYSGIVLAPGYGGRPAP